VPAGLPRVINTISAKTERECSVLPRLYFEMLLVVCAGLFLFPKASLGLVFPFENYIRKRNISRTRRTHRRPAK
jgi:hypothetical protein